MIKAGKRYRVNKVTYPGLSVGDIIVAIEDNDIPYCIREEHYVDGKDLDEYDTDLIYAISSSNIEEVHYDN